MLFLEVLSYNIFNLEFGAVIIKSFRKGIKGKTRAVTRQWR